VLIFFDGNAEFSTKHVKIYHMLVLLKRYHKTLLFVISIDFSMIRFVLFSYVCTCLVLLIGRTLYIYVKRVQYTRLRTGTYV